MKGFLLWAPTVTYPLSPKIVKLTTKNSGQVKTMFCYTIHNWRNARFLEVHNNEKFFWSRKGNNNWKNEAQINLYCGNGYFHCCTVLTILSIDRIFKIWNLIILPFIFSFIVVIPGTEYVTVSVLVCIIRCSGTDVCASPASACHLNEPLRWENARKSLKIIYSTFASVLRVDKCTWLYMYM